MVFTVVQLVVTFGRGLFGPARSEGVPFVLGEHRPHERSALGKLLDLLRYPS